MGTASSGMLDRLRQPEYTGENRCIPCTIVNVAIAIVISSVLAVLFLPLGPAFLAIALVAIYLRGYLVPGTPTLTKKYFPDRVLRWFDKEPIGVDAPVAGQEAELDPEPILLEAGVVELCQGGADLCATEAFESAWWDRIEELRTDGGLETYLADLLDADPEEVEVDERDSFTVVTQDGHAVARWESRAALLADVAAAPVLESEYDGWDDHELHEKGRLLNGVRVFLERCPECDGELAFGQDTRESCCRSVEIVALECTECEALLLEVEAPEEAQEEAEPEGEPADLQAEAEKQTEADS